MEIFFLKLFKNGLLSLHHNMFIRVDSCASIITSKVLII